MHIPEGEYRVGTDDDYYVRTNIWSAPGCHGAACGAILHIKDGKLVDIEGDESNPITNGRLCIKCLGIPEYQYHPDRIISCESCGGTKRKLVRPLANEVGGASREGSRLARRGLS